MTRLALTIACGLVILGTAPILPVFAQDSSGWVQLRGDELRAAYSGQTLDLVYNNVGFAGKAHHTETHNPDGTTDYDEGGVKLDGRWSLSGAPGLEDRICYVYAQLDPYQRHCFYVFRDGKCLYGYSASWFPNAQAIRPELWRVKGANREDGPSCDIFVS